ncbi:MAG: class I SAM-dependent DNA methyltransferase [Bacteroidales bacterium]
MDQFADKAAEWDKNPVRAAMIERFVGEIIDSVQLDKTSNILDFGCGTGVIGLHLLPKVARATFVDSSPAMMSVLSEKIAAGNLQNTQSVVGNIELYDAENCEDLIVSLMAMHHVEDINATLASFHKLLKTGGQVFIGDSVAEDGSFHHPEVVPHNGFDTKWLTNQFMEAGFKVENVDIFHTMVRKISTGEERPYPLFALLARKN